MAETTNRRCEFRFQCNMPGVIHSPGHPSFGSVVNDVSESGLLLATKEHYDPGTWISLALPDKPNELISLRVARVDHDPGGGWLIGCIFVYD